MDQDHLLGREKIGSNFRAHKVMISNLYLYLYL